MSKRTSKQVKKAPNPTGKGGFGDNPQNRHNGAWKKEDTPRFKLEQMMKLPETELKKLAKDTNAPLFERKIAIALAKGDWKEIREMIHEVYGRPQESVDVTSSGDKITGITVEIINATKPESDTSLREEQQSEDTDSSESRGNEVE